MRLTDPFKPVHAAIENMISHASSAGAKIEMIDMLIEQLEQAKENLCTGPMVITDSGLAVDAANYQPFAPGSPGRPEWEDPN